MMVPDHEEARVLGFKGHLQNIVREPSCIVLFLTLPGNLIIWSAAKYIGLFLYTTPPNYFDPWDGVVL